MDADRLLYLCTYAPQPPVEGFRPTTAAWLRERLRQIEAGCEQARRRERQEVLHALHLLATGLCVCVAHCEGAVYYGVRGGEAPLLAIGPDGRELRLAGTRAAHWPWSAMPLPRRGLWIGNHAGYLGPVSAARLLRHGFTAQEVERALALLRPGRHRHRASGEGPRHQ